MLANVLQLLKLPDGTVKVLVEGVARVRITEYLDNEEFFEARAEYLTEMPGDTTTIEALLRTVTNEFERYAKVKKNIPEEALAAVSESDEPAKLADLVAGHLGIEVGQKQELAGDAFGQRAAGEGLWPDAGRNERSAGREEDQDAREIADGAHAAGILPE